MTKLTAHAAALAAPLVLSLWGCEQKPPEPTPEKPATTSQPSPKPTAASTETQPTKGATAGELSWRKPDAWQEAPNPNAMRKATYTVPKAEGDSEDAELSVSTAGGSVDANVKRWEGQFEGAPAAKKSEKQVGDLKVTVVEITGTYKGGGPMMGGGGEPKKDWMMLAAIAHTDPQMHFFKLTGPKKTVEGARADFDVLVGSFAMK